MVGPLPTIQIPSSDELPITADASCICGLAASDIPPYPFSTLTLVDTVPSAFTSASTLLMLSGPNLCIGLPIGTPQQGNDATFPSLERNKPPSPSHSHGATDALADTEEFQLLYDRAHPLTAMLPFKAAVFPATL